MIKNIEELQLYLLHDLEQEDEIIFKRPLMMTSPGCSLQELKILKGTFPDLPNCYLKIVEKINLNGISVGYFEVSPASFNPEGMLANIIEGNQPDILFWQEMQQYHLYSVATISEYGVFIATNQSPFKEGEVILISVDIFNEDNPSQWIYRLSKNFEQFLIVAGNLNQIHREIQEDNSNYEIKKEEFFTRLKILEVAEEYYPAWERVF